jgi:hypothetical protein
MSRVWKNCARFTAAIAILLGAGAGAMAEDGAAWLVGKSSGEVWVTVQGAQQASLTEQAQLKAGDTIRTGRNGRVLLSRGEESILVSPNSVVGIAEQSKQGLSTTILQQAGSILLEVEKRNVKHFEVETPYLAAVVKGTQFRVSVNATGTSVDVLRGQVEVADFKSGQIAQVLPGQVATAFAQGKSGLALRGTGPFNPIEQGKPRAPSIERITVPKAGLPAPHNAGNGQQIRTVAPFVHAAGGLLGGARPGAAPMRSADHAAATRSTARITSSLGEVRLDFRKVTNGLARGAAAPNSHSGRTATSRNTIWSSSEAKASTAAASSSGQGNSVDSGNSAASSTSSASAAAATTAAATATAATSAGSNSSGSNSVNGSTGNGKGNSGNGQGNNGNGNNGNGNGNGNNGNNGNGKGNNGNGHGKS